MNEGRISEFVARLGAEIDRVQKNLGGMPTAEITAALCRLAASAAAICNPSRPAFGIEFGYNEFLNQIQLQCVHHGINGVRIVQVSKPADMEGH